MFGSAQHSAWWPHSRQLASDALMPVRTSVRPNSPTHAVRQILDNYHKYHDMDVNVMADVSLAG